MKNLKEKTNDEGDKYYVNKQIPEEFVEAGRELREIVRDQKLKDKNLPSKQKSSIEVKQGAVYIDGHKVEKQLLPPQPIELFVDKAEREKMDKIKLSASDTISLNGSDFLGFAYKSWDIPEIKRAYHKLRGLHPSADHITAANNLRNSSAFQDDGEFGAGTKLLQILKDERPLNIVVFVVRYHKGEKLGPVRFEHMKQAAEQAITRLH